MAYEKDSAILILQTGEDGYFVRYFVWGESPPPLSQELATAIEIHSRTTPKAREDRISADKTALKAELSSFVDTYFDVS